MFSFRRKSGFPKISDHGIADVAIAGKGLSISIEIEAVTGKRNQVFRTKDVTVEIDDMTWKIRDSKVSVTSLVNAVLMDSTTFCTSS